MVGNFPFQMLPIIQPGSFERAVVDAKPQRSDQPQLGLQGDTRATDRPGILRDFRVVQNDMQLGFVSHFGCRFDAIVGVFFPDPMIWSEYRLLLLFGC